MKKRSTKSALISSVLALLLCVSMLLGTTYAWFTDKVESANNIIKSGNLDIELEYLADNGKWTDVEGSSTILDPDALWEPGYTQVVYLRMRNAGSLALKYQFGIQINDEKPGMNSEGTFLLSDYIYFGVDKDVVADKDGKVTEYANRAAAQAAVAEDALQIKKGYSDFGTLLKDSGYQYMALVVYMPTTVGNVANYVGVAPEINLGISVFATQTDAETEQDSFGSDYDANAAITVEPGESIADAIANVEDGGIVYLANGEHTVGSVITISGKKVSIVGVGEVTLQYATSGGSHFFNVADSSEVTFENLTMLNAAKHGVYVRNNSKVTMKDVTINGSRGSADIMVDEASDAAHGLETASYVTLYNCDIDRIAMCASPVTTVAATQDTYVYLNYDANTTIGSIEKQSINTKPENIYINGINVEGNGMNLYVTNDAELAAALNTIKTNSKYHNVQVYVHLAAGVYSGNYEINQYPAWNGVAGAGATANNYASGVPAGAPGTVITFVGESAATTFAANSASVPGVVFTGKITVNGFGNAGTGFGSTFAHTTFENVAFDGTDVPAVDGDIISVALMAAADNVTFNGCYFANTTHITLGGRGEHRVDDVVFDGCTFVDAGSLSGYPLKVTLTGCQADGADGGFLNIQNQAEVVVEDCTVNVGRFFIRTNGTGVKLNVTDSDITVYESEDAQHLVWFRGSEESALFEDCTIAEGYTNKGLDENSTLTLRTTTDDGLKLDTDGETGKVTLYLVPAEYEGNTVNVPEGVDAIGNFAFKHNTNVKTVVLSSTVRDLGRGFDESTVEKVVLNEGLETISSRAFRSTPALKEVVFSSTVTKIEDNTFQKSGIKEIVIPASVTTIGETAFGASLIEKVTMEGDIDIQGYAFRGCTKLNTVVLNGMNVNFVKSELNGRNSMWFCNGESNNPNTSNITFYVKNDVIKERVLTAMGAERDNTPVICEMTTQEGGYFTDDEGNAYAYDAKGLDAALKNTDVETIILPTDLLFSSSETTANSGYGATGVSVAGGTLNGNGNSLGITDWGTWASAISTTGGTIKNITINSGMRGIFVDHHSAHTETVYLDNVIIDGTVYTISCDQASNQGLVATNSTFNGWTSYAATIGEVKFTGCSFGEGQGYSYCRPYAPTKFVNCDFEAGYTIEPCAAVSFENCTLDGKDLTSANLSELVTNVNMVTLDGTAQKKADSQDSFNSAMSSQGNVDITLGAGEFKMPSSSTSAEISISGTKDTVIDMTMGAYMDSANVTITGVTIKTGTGYANGNGSDYAALYTPNVTYVDCTFVGPMRVGRDGAKFVNCTFTALGNDYVWTYGNDVTFEGCTFNTDGKAILIYSDGGNEVSKVTVKNCTFTSTQGAKAGAIANQNCAAIEIHNYGNGVDLVTEGNEYDANFSGEWRIKTYENGKPKVFVNGTEYTSIALDGKLMTIDANKNVTVAD